MEAFAWRRPKSIEEAVCDLNDCDNPKLLAGGMTLIPTLKQNLAAPSHLVDLGHIIGLSDIRIEGDRLVIGAMTRHVDVAESDVVRRFIPALSTLAGGIGDPCVRRRGTIGGSLANSDPAADYPAGALGLAAEIETNERRIQADDFFLGLFETALGDSEILTAVRFAIPDQAHYIKFPHPVSGYAVVGVMVARYGNAIRVGITGAGPNAFRASEMEKALERSFSPDAIDSCALDPSDLLGDLHCSAVYRAHVAGVLVKRAVAAML